jgi:hypothetical protein
MALIMFGILIGLILINIPVAVSIVLPQLPELRSAAFH